MAKTAEATRPADTERPAQPAIPAQQTTPARPAIPAGAGNGAPLWTRPVRGRHRRPRPRRTLFAVSGLALAAGALSLVRLAPEPLGGGAAHTEAGSPGPDATADPAGTAAGNAAATVEPAPAPGSARASATAVMGGASPTPTAGATAAPSPTAGAPSPSRRAEPATDRTGIPDAPADRVTPPPPAPSQPAPASPAPRPSPSHSSRAPEPGPADPGLCVPVIGLCVDPLVRGSRSGG